MPPLNIARAAAENLVAEMLLHCQCVTIAGSVRRQSPYVKDIEIVAIPALGVEAASLFDTRPYDRLERWLTTVVAAGRHPTIDRMKEYAGRAAPWGHKFKKLTIRQGEFTFPVDLFIAAPETYVPTLVLRTGPADFSRLLVTSEEHGGAMPNLMRQHDGRLERAEWHGKVNGGSERIWTPIETADEASYFALLRVPCWAPHERTEARLIDHLTAQGRGPHRTHNRGRHGSAAPSSSYAPFRQQEVKC